jgi:hypothetical protein
MTVSVGLLLGPAVGWGTDLGYRIAAAPGPRTPHELFAKLIPGASVHPETELQAVLESSTKR